MMSTVLEALKAIQDQQKSLAAEVESVSQRLDTLAPPAQSPNLNEKSPPEPANALPAVSALPEAAIATPPKEASVAAQVQAEKSGFTSRIILT
jgi:hypothetical protein